MGCEFLLSPGISLFSFLTLMKNENLSLKIILRRGSECSGKDITVVGRKTGFSKHNFDEI
jgi:hypothetical protein